MSGSHVGGNVSPTPGTSPAPLFAFSTDESGRVKYIGEVVSEANGAVRLNAVNVLLLWGGFWELSGELVDEPRGRCRLFVDRDSMLDAADACRIGV